MMRNPGLRTLLPVLCVLLLSAVACALPSAPIDATATAIPTPARLATATRTPQPPTEPPAPVPTVAQEPPTTVPPAAPETGEVTIYFVALEDNGGSGIAVGCGDSLVAVKRTIAPTREPIAAALGQLFAIKDQNIGQSGLYNALWQSNLHVVSATVDASGTATVVIEGKVQMGGECDTPRFKGQIEQTILSVGGVKAANVFLNGQPIDQALSLK